MHRRTACAIAAYVGLRPASVGTHYLLGGGQIGRPATSTLLAVAAPLATLRLCSSTTTPGVTERSGDVVSRDTAIGSPTIEPTGSTGVGVDATQHSDHNAPAQSTGTVQGPFVAADEARQHYEKFVRSFLGGIPAEQTTATDISPFLKGWSDDVSEQLRQNDLVPRKLDDTPRDAFKGLRSVVENHFVRSDKDASRRSLSIDTIVDGVQQIFRHDPAPRSFIKAANMGKKKLQVAKDHVVALLANDKDWGRTKDRHVKPFFTTVVDGIRAGSPISRDVLERAVVLLYGPSGSGKTTGAFVTAHRYDGVCALLQPDPTIKDSEGALHEAKIVEMLAKDDASSPDKDASPSKPKQRNTETRDTMVCNYIVARIKDLVPPDSRLQPEDKTRPLVVVLDEMGDYPQFVRGVISARGDIVRTLKEEVTGGNPVYIIVSGTGVEGATHEPGTIADKYELYRAQPGVWDHVKNDSSIVPESVQKVMADETGPEVQLARQLVGNARACMLFVRAFQEEEVLNMASNDAVQWSPGGATHVTPLDVRLVRIAAAFAANKFKPLNGLKELTMQEHLGAMLHAVALQSVIKPTKAVDRWRVAMSARYGVSVDRATVTKHAGDAPQTDKHVVEETNSDTPKSNQLLIDQTKDGSLWLSKDAEGVRYEVEPASMAILLLLHRLGDRGTSPDSFEENVMDFLVWGVHASQKYFAPQSDNGEYFQRSVETEHCRSRAWRYPKAPCKQTVSLCEEQLFKHHRWRYPLELIAVLRDMRAAVGMQDDPLHVLFYRAKEYIVNEDQLVSAVEAAALDRNVPDDTDVAHVVVNKEQAAAQDLSVYMRGAARDAVLHVQCKRFTSGKISDLEVFRELHKMGHKDWRCALASVVGMSKDAAAACAKEDKSPARRAFAQLARKSGLFRTFADAINKVEELVASNRQSNLRDDVRAVVNGSSRKRASKLPYAPRYALLLYVGSQPVPQAPLSVELPKDVTVYACCHDDAELASRDEPGSAAARLRGLYPLAIGRPCAVNGASPPPETPRCG